MHRSTAALVSIASVALAGVVGGSYGPRQPREAVWYSSLRKPSFTPPGSAIAVTWGVLETLLCVTGYRLLTRPASAARTLAVTGWSATLGGLAGFPAAFFGRKQLGTSTAVAAAMFASTSATAAAAARADNVSAVAMIPLVTWTAFALLLSEELWRRNG
jgi:tryptophan-rich sensory protein